MENHIITTIIVATLGSTALFEFLKYLLTRKDNKGEQFKQIMDEISKLRDEVTKLQDNMSKFEAVSARIRILNASDEIRMKVRHSEEWFNQVNEDITTYNRYCSKNPSFKNNKAVHAIENINYAYKHALQNNDFL